MATSGSSDFQLNRDQIISAALRKLRVVDPRLTVPAQDITDGSQALNLMVKSWQLDGIYLWLNQEVVLHLESDGQYYDLGPSGDHAGVSSDCFKTQLSVAGAAADLTITVDDDDDIADGDHIGIELDDGTLQWTTVNGAPALNVVTLTDALDSAAAVDNYVFTHTNYISRPVRIIEARVRDTDEIDTPLNIIESRTEFMRQTDKTTTGEPLDLYYEPLITNGRLYVWPVALDVTDRIVMTVQRVIEDFDSSADNADCPVEALQALVWNLAVEIAPEYGVDLTMGKGTTVIQQAARYYNLVKRAYTHRDPVYLRP
jgi:hypothetical protein